MGYAQVGPLRLHYEEAGLGEIGLMCLHGISSNSASWRYQLAGLSDRYRVIAWDAPGYGGSDDPPGGYPLSWLSDSLADLLDELGLEKVVVVGLSMGGVVAQEFAGHYPARLSALVLADTNTGGGARPPDERKARLDARLKAIETLTPREIARQRAPALLSPQAPPALLAEVEDMIARLHPVGYRQAAIALDGADTRPVLAQIAVPTLVLWGEHDSITPRPEAQTLYEGIPQAQFEIIQGAGHLSNLEKPERFNQALRDFLAAL